MPDSTWKEGEWWKKEREAHLKDRKFAGDLEHQQTQLVNTSIFELIFEENRQNATIRS